VADSIGYGATTLERYDLIAWVVMPNHVHMLIEVNVALSVVMKTLKCYTARQANKILGRTGQFWHHESFDHWVRNDEELRRIIRYIENNPVKARLAARPENYRWSSAFGNVSRQACDFNGSK
jgi:putative transposase